MRFSCQANLLVEALSTAGRAVSARTTQQILEGILLEATDEGLTVTGSDGAMSIVASVEAVVSEPGELVLPARLFLEVARKLPPESELEATTRNNYSLRIVCNGSRVNIAGQNADSYPPLPSVDAEHALTLPQPVLRDMIQQTSFAIASDESRPTLTGCLLDVEPGRATMVALDGFRMAVRYVEIGETSPFSAIIPGKSLNELVKLLSDDMEEMVTLSFGGRQLTLTAQGVRFYTVLIDGSFLNYRNILPTEFPTRVSFRREPFAACVERAALMAREGKNNLFKMEISGDRMILTSNSEHGDAYEELDVATEGEDVVIAFNVKYVSDIMRVVQDEELRLLITSPVSPCLVAPVAGEAFVHLVLPVRVNG